MEAKGSTAALRIAGIGVYVSRVEQGGPAWRAGLRPGDLLLAANNTNFSSVTHAEAIAVSMQPGP